MRCRSRVSVPSLPLFESPLLRAFFVLGASNAEVLAGPATRSGRVSTSPERSLARRSPTVRPGLIAVLLVTEVTVAKFAAHRVTPEEVRQVNDGDRVVIRNPRPRVEGSVLLNPDPFDPGAWDVRTAWEASAGRRPNRDDEMMQSLYRPMT